MNRSLTVLFLSLALAAPAAADVLALVTPGPLGRAPLEGSPVRVYRELGTSFVARLCDADLPILENAGCAWHVLDAPFRTGEYFVVPRVGSGALAAPGITVYEDARLSIVRLPEAEAYAAKSTGLVIYPLSRRGRAIVPTADERFAWSPDTAVARLVGMMSLDTLMADVRRLQNFGTRYTHNRKCDSAGLWLYGQFAELGWQVALDTYRINATRTFNVEATLPGAVRPDSIVIACAHYDSYCETNQNNAPGADDNATGTAILLELARALKTRPFRWTVKLLAFSGEEQWMKGSYHWVDSTAVPQGLSIYGAFNVDMIGYTAYDSNYLVLNRDVNSAPMAALAESTNHWYGIGLRLLNFLDPDCYGDNTPFWEHGFKSTFALEDSEWGIWNGSNPHYHTTHDTVGIITRGQVVRTAQLTVAGVAHVAGPVSGSGIVEVPGAAPQARPEPMLLAGELALPSTGRYELFSADGRSVGRASTRLPAGVYYLKTEEGTPPRRLVKIR
ncbi:MAG: M28 family peptidase [bacterium]